MRLENFLNVTLLHNKRKKEQTVEIIAITRGFCPFLPSSYYNFTEWKILLYEALKYLFLFSNIIRWTFSFIIFTDNLLIITLKVYLFLNIIFDLI